ncbi:MAG: homocysteine S-methyltransferase family protein [Ardenticatenaceae bacterium]|nr:homocysteine S-methyltransferase family protein [Ardenticatenaceae bacterium]
MNRLEFRQRVCERPLLLDGAMGTMLHTKGVPIDQSFDAINQYSPAIVADIHRAYIEAGADVIETNSFGANRFKLAEYGLQNRSRRNQQGASVDVACRVTKALFKPAHTGGGAIRCAGLALPGRCHGHRSC